MTPLIFEQYQERLLRLNAADRTLRNHRRTAALFVEAGLDETAQDWQIEEWLASLPHAPRTKLLHFQNVQSVMRYAARRGVIQGDPTELVRLPRVADQEPRILEASELRAVKARIWTGQQALLFHLLAYTGMRRSEVANLTWDDVSAPSLRVLGKGGEAEARSCPSGTGRGTGARGG